MKIERTEWNNSKGNFAFSHSTSDFENLVGLSIKGRVADGAWLDEMVESNVPERRVWQELDPFYEGEGVHG